MHTKQHVLRVLIVLALISLFGTAVAAAPIHQDDPATGDADVTGAPAGANAPSAILAPADQVIADDLIVQYSACIGTDCVNGEDFGYDTLRLKENNLRLHFDDTSVSSGFPSNDWRIIINDSASGGAAYFAVEDATAGRQVFRIDAGARVDALHVDAAGRVGFGTANPATTVHLRNGNTPAIRLEQDGSGGFPPQAWDLAANEAGFYIQDVTNANLRPFRIRPGAPHNSLVINAGGDVGLGTDAPAGPFEVREGADSLMLLEATTGNLTIKGALAQNSDVNVKENFSLVNGLDVLARVTGLPISTWNFKAEDAVVRHMGPMAQDFYAAFGLGNDDRHIATLDTGGVALAAIQGLSQLVQEQDAQLAQLAQQNEALEARIEALEHGQPSTGILSGNTWSFALLLLATVLWLLIPRLVKARAAGNS
jgi:hypothetical protein